MPATNTCMPSACNPRYAGLVTSQFKSLLFQNQNRREMGFGGRGPMYNVGVHCAEKVSCARISAYSLITSHCYSSSTTNPACPVRRAHFRVDLADTSGTVLARSPASCFMSRTFRPYRDRVPGPIAPFQIGQDMGLRP